jgi:Ca2+-transporting ATPase
MGLRTLAFGYKLLPKEIINLENYPAVLSELVLVGFAGISDPLRPDVKKTLMATQKAGLKTVIITGDNKITAKTIARELELDGDETTVMDGEQLLKINDEELEKKVKDVKVYARVTPQDKLRIVSAWQKQGAVVAMTGDGINDAPALKKADIGVALGSGTDVAKETADLVLLNNSFNTLVAAIEQGRIIYDNIKKVILYLLSDSFSEVIIVFGSLVFNWPLPLLPTQILWINLVTDSLPNTALALEPGEKAVMNEQPQERDKPILDNERKLLIGIISLVTGITNLVIFYFFWKIVGDLTLARSVIFVSLGMDSLLYVFSCRSLRYSLFNIKFFNNRYLLLAVIFGALLQILAIYLPFFQKALQLTAISWYEWSLVLAISLFVILIIEVVKWIFLIRKKRYA